MNGFIGVYEVEATVCPRATTNNRLSGRKWFLGCPLWSSCFDVPFSFSPVTVLFSRCVSPKTTRFPGAGWNVALRQFRMLSTSRFRFCLHQFSKRISGVKHLCYAVLNEWALVRMRRIVFKFINKASTQQVTWRHRGVLCQFRDKGFLTDCPFHDIESIYDMYCTDNTLKSLMTCVPSMFDVLVLRSCRLIHTSLLGLTYNCILHCH